MDIIKERYLAFTKAQVLDSNGDPIDPSITPFFAVTVGRTNQISTAVDYFTSELTSNGEPYGWLLDFKSDPLVVWLNSVYSLRISADPLIQDLKPFGICNLVIDFGEKNAFRYYKHKCIIDPGFSAITVFYDEYDVPVLQADVYQGGSGTVPAESFRAITHRGRIIPYLT